jgi:hypothetical protein
MARVASWAQTTTAVFLVENPEEILAEKDFPDAWLHGFQADDFATKGAPDKSLASVPEKPAISRDAALEPS